MASLALHHLSLVPIPIAQVREPNDPEFEKELVDEATQLLDHPSWTDKKAWHGGVVETYSLPQGSVSYAPAAAGGQSSASPTGNAGEEGILFHKRVSRFRAKEHGGYETWWDGLGDNHIGQEEEYVDNVTAIIDVGKKHGKKECYLKLYKLPFGATDRSFLCNVVVVSPSSSPSSQPAQSHSKSSDKDTNSSDASSAKKGSREFLVFSLPIDAGAPLPEEKKYVRGMSATVERIKELEGGEVIEWTCASLSTPGGSIPVKLSESKMAQSLADGVPSILTWMTRAHPPSASSVKTGTYTASSDASAVNPTKPRVTTDVANPGGGMGTGMPAGRFTLEMFQQPVPLRDY